MRRDHLLFWIVPVLAASGCLKGAQHRGDERSGGGEDCASIPVPSDPLLVGLDQKVRAAIASRAARGLVVVEYVVQGCDVKLNVLDDCRTAGSYTYRSVGKREQRVIEKERVLLEVLPLAGTALYPTLAKQGALRLDQLRVGRLEAEAKRPAVDGDGCALATHVAVAIVLGGATVTAGQREKLGGEGDFMARRTEGIELIETAGDAKACARAAKRGERVAGCDLPLQVALVPIAREPKAQLVATAITNGAPEGGMVAVPAGEGWQGNDAEKSEAPRHRVQLDAYTIDRYEVTARDYDACVKAGACTPARTGGFCTSGVPEKANHPINCVTWEQADKYCTQAKLRLPTEAEWERAGRGTDGQPFAWGNAWPPPARAANLADATATRAHSYWAHIPGYDDGYAETAPVGSFRAKPAPSGALDLAGNVMEWTADWYGAYPKGETKNPTGPKRGDARVVRGGSYGHHRPLHISVTARAAYQPDVSSEHIGFRCAK